MSAKTIEAASTDQYCEVKVWTTADGAPKTDLVFNTSGLAIWYQIGNAAPVEVVVGGSPAPASMSAGGAHADWGIYHIAQGRYKIGLADAVVASAASVTVWIVFTDCDSAACEIDVVGYDKTATAVGANTVAPATPTNVTDARDAVLAKLPTALVGGRIDAHVGVMANNTVNAAALATDAVQEIRSEIDSNSTQLAAIVADTDELQQIGIAAELTAIQGATFDTLTDSLEAIRNRGDVAWITGTGGGGGGSAPTVEEIRAEIDANSTQLAAILQDTGTTIPALFPANFADLTIASGGGTITVDISGNVTTAGLTADALQDIWQQIDQNSVKLDRAMDYAGYCLTVLAGATSNPQAAEASYTLTLDSGTHTVTYSALTSAGVRLGPTLNIS